MFFFTAVRHLICVFVSIWSCVFVSIFICLIVLQSKGHTWSFLFATISWWLIKTGTAMFLFDNLILKSSNWRLHRKGRWLLVVIECHVFILVSRYRSTIGSLPFKSRCSFHLSTTWPSCCCFSPCCCLWGHEGVEAGGLYMFAQLGGKPQTSRASKQQQTNKSSELTFQSSFSSPRSPNLTFLSSLHRQIFLSTTFLAQNRSLLSSETLLTPLPRPPPARHWADPYTPEERRLATPPITGRVAAHAQLQAAGPQLSKGPKAAACCTLGQLGRRLCFCLYLWKL